mmetsp:Transcript_38301/g.89084  ORF Transcript_38301/g.89084 Transcript_38301/m.89084 type:complete len:206 (+) Transcript_38301:188-805(+)
MQDPRRCVDLVDGRLKMVLLGDPRRGLRGILVVDPPRVHAVHVHPVSLRQVLGAGPGEHVQGRLGHVGVRMPGRLVPIELSLHGADVDYVPRRPPLPPGRQEGVQAGVEDEGGDGVDEKGFHHLGGGDVLELEEPAVVAAQVQLLAVDVGEAGGEEGAVGYGVFGEEGGLGEEGAAGDAGEVEGGGGGKGIFDRRGGDLGERGSF